MVSLDHRCHLGRRFDDIWSDVAPVIRPQFDDDESGGGLDRHDEVGRHDDETRVIVMQSDKIPDS